MSAHLYIVAAIEAETRAIGFQGKLPWYIPEDLLHFRALTSRTTAALIMGSGTYRSIGRTLPGRLTFVVSKKEQFEAGEEVWVIHDPEEAIGLSLKGGVQEIWVSGGQSLYEYFLSRAEKLFLTLVWGEIPGADRYFPPYEDQFLETERSEVRSHAGLQYAFATYARRG